LVSFWRNIVHHPGLHYAIAPSESKIDENLERLNRKQKLGHHE